MSGAERTPPPPLRWDVRCPLCGEQMHYQPREVEWKCWDCRATWDHQDPDFDSQGVWTDPEAEQCPSLALRTGGSTRPQFRCQLAVGHEGKHRGQCTDGQGSAEEWPTPWCVETPAEVSRG